MRKVEYPPSLQTLIQELRRMPGVGPRSAERIALWIIQAPNARAIDISEAIKKVSAGILSCQECGFFAEEKICAICSDPSRERSVLCVVEQPTDVLPLERTGAFRGLYHTLGGKLSPLNHVGPEDLRFEALLRRIKEMRPAELILAVGTDVEGEATASYIVHLLEGMEIRVSRLAQGLPAGFGLDNADEATIANAYRGRIDLLINRAGKS
ncbi:MAG: recombination protein RecR [Verrucomicrobia bacterium]|nr:recombination protein RecR [Verrucomicrobiota bacterium]